ncbi:uncharacterized protein LOC142652539 [Rhinoderma darwinii]|uniref:uncharacterized protein LOC142652539 n=1 Tax=Rhinoderma darwinii TaxID=43563 RepID=UPI003F67F404
MEDSSSSNIEPEPQFFCHLCSISCASALNLQSHFLGMKHRKVEEAVRNNTTGENKTDDEEQIFVKPNATLQEQVDACKNSEPALGLEYIYQYKKHGFNTYECKLCECRSGLTHMFMHIVGAKHRITYLSKHHPSLGISGPYIMKGPKKLRKLRETCLTVEKEFGRQKINVMEGMESEWSFSTDISGASSVYYNPDSEQEHLDFTTDDFFDTDDKPAASEHDVTFLDLKSAHEASQKAAESSDCISQTAEESEEGKHKKDTENEESKKDIHEKEVHSKEPCESGPNFTNTEELLDFLEHFRILEITDAKFVITVVEMLSIAVVRYKTACKENNKKDLSVSKSHATNKPGKCKKQDPKPSVVQPQAKQGPVSEFNSTSPPGETKPPVPSSSSSMPRVSTIKSKEITLLSDPLLNNQVSIDQPGSSSATTPDQSLGPERKSPEKLFPVSKPNNTGRLGERKKLIFTVSSNKSQGTSEKVPSPQAVRFVYY